MKREETRMNQATRQQTKTQDNTQLLTQIEQLQREKPNTLELYVAVAHLLFFQHDTIPTTNRMYQLVRRGSMGTPAKALRIFWAQLRSHAQVRMQKAPLPNHLLNQAEQLLGSLWDEAVQLAQQALEKQRLRLNTEKQLLKDVKHQYKIKRQGLLNEKQIIKKQLKDEKMQYQTLFIQHQKLQQKYQNLREEQLIKAEQWKATEKEHQQALEAQRLEKEGMEKQIHAIEQRAQEHEKRALMKIEKTRQESKKTQEKAKQQIYVLEQKLQQWQQQAEDKTKTNHSLKAQLR